MAKNKLKGYSFDFSQSTFALRQHDFSYTKNDGMRRHGYEYSLYVTVDVSLNSFYECCVGVTLVVDAIGEGWKLHCTGGSYYTSAMLRAIAAFTDEINKRWNDIKPSYGNFNAMNNDHVIDAILERRFIEKLHDVRSEVAPIDIREGWRRNEMHVRAQKIQEQLDYYKERNLNVTE